MTKSARWSVTKPKLQLPDLTVCAADSAYPRLAARALEICLERCDFGDAILFSDTAVAGNFRHVAIDRLKSLDDYNRFCLRDMPRLTDTPYVLVVQWDGYVVDPGMWTGVFRKYDYIGALIYPADGRVFVGNGGFSLRSRKLLNALPTLPAAAPGLPEDVVICKSFRQVLERDFGVVFAPLPIASRFSYEVKYPGRSTFGFHGAPNFWRHDTDEEIIDIYENLPPRSLFNFNSFGLMINCLRSDRSSLAVALYGRARTEFTAEAIEAEMMRSIPRELVRRSVALLEGAYRSVSSPASKSWA